MVNCKNVLLVLATIVLTACHTAPTQSILLRSDSLGPQSGKVGIAVTSAKVDTSFPGASCLLCIAAASVANSALTTHAHAMTNLGVLKFKEAIADTLRKKGAEVVVLADEVNVSALKKNDSGGIRTNHRCLLEQFNLSPGTGLCGAFVTLLAAHVCVDLRRSAKSVPVCSEKVDPSGYTFTRTRLKPGGQEFANNSI